MNLTNNPLQQSFVDGADWTKGYNAWHTTTPHATRMNAEVLERWERRGKKKRNIRETSGVREIDTEKAGK